MASYTSIEEYIEKNPVQVGEVPKDYSVPNVYQAGAMLNSKYDKNILLENLDKVGDIRAHRQGKMAQLGNALNQALVGEIVGGTIEGAGYILDLEGIVNTFNQTEQEWGNFISDIGKSLKTWTQDVSPIYRDSHADDFNPSSWSWWMDNLPSVTSTLSLLIPATGVVKGVGMVGKALNIGQKMGKTASWMTTGLGQAVASRYMENLMEASGTFENTYEKLKEEGMEDVEARKAAAKGAQFSWNTNWVMLAQDIPQYLALGTIKAPKSSIAVEKALKTKGLSNKLVQAQIKKPYELLKNALGEGFEEGYQFVIGEESERIAELAAGRTDDTPLSERLAGYVGKGEFWTSAFFGALGGGLFQVVGEKLNNAVLNSKGILTEEQARVNEIKERGTKMAHFAALREEARALHDETAQEFVHQSFITHQAVEAAALGNAQSFVEEFETNKETYGLLDSDLVTVKNAIAAYNKAAKNNSAPFAKKIATASILKDVYGGQIKSLTDKITKLKDSEVLLEDVTIIGRDILDHEILIEGHQKTLDYLKTRIKSGELTQNRKEAYDKSVKFHENKVKGLTASLESIRKKDTRTDEEISTDAANSETVNVRDLAKANYELELAKIGHKFQAELYNKYSDKKEQAKMEAKEVKANVKNTEKVIDSKLAQDQPVDMNEMFEAEGTVIEPAINKGAMDALNHQTTTAPEVIEVTTDAVEERYKGREFLFAKESEDLFKALTDAKLPTGFLKIAKQGMVSPEAFKDLINSIVIGASTGGNSSKQALKVIGEFYKSRAKKVTVDIEEAIPIREDQELLLVTPNTPSVMSDHATKTNTPDTGSLDGNANPFSTHIPQFKMLGNQFEFDPKTKLYEEILANTTTFRIDFDFLNKPGNVNVGDELEYEVDLDVLRGAGAMTFFKSLGFKTTMTASGKEVYVDSLEDMMATPQFQRNALIRIIHKKSGKIVGVVPGLDTTDKLAKGEKLDQLVKLRADIFSEVLNGNTKAKKYTFSVPTRVTKVHAGRWFALHEDIAQELQQSVDKILENPENMILAVSVGVDGKMELHIPNQDKDSPIPEVVHVDATHFSGIRKEGVTYIMLQNSAGEWVPYRLFNKPVINKDGTYTNKELYDSLISALEDLNTVPFETVMSVVSDIAFLNLKYLKETDSIVIEERQSHQSVTTHPIKRTELRTDPNMLKVLSNTPLQISSKNINRKSKTAYGKFTSYNMMVATQGRVWTDLNPFQHTHSGRIDFAVYQRPSEAPSVEDMPAHDEVINSTEPISSGTEVPIGPVEEVVDVNKVGPELTPEVKDEEVKTGNVSESELPTETTPRDKVAPTPPTIKTPSGKGKASGKRFKIKGKDSTTWNREEEERWFRDRFPNVPLHVLPNLKSILEGGEVAWGTFYNAAVYIQEQAGVGTAYHEAFHVVFNLYLTPKQQQQLLEEEAAKSPLMAGEVDGVMKQIPGLTEAEAKIIALEERIADRFQEYVETEMADKSWSAPLRRFFQGLWQLIKQAVSDRTSMKDVFQRTNSWTQKYRKPLPKNVERFKEAKPRFKIPDMKTPEEQHRRVVTINDELIRHMNIYRESNPNNPAVQNAHANDTYHDLAKTFGIDTFYSMVETTLKNDLETETDPYVRDRLDKLLKHFIIGKKESGANIYGDLGKYAIRELAVRGIKVKLRGDTLVVSRELGPQVEQTDDIEVDAVEETTSRLDGWQVRVEQMSGKDSLSREIRTVLTQIPLPMMENGKPVLAEDGSFIEARDDLGYVMYYQFDRIYNTLKMELRDIYSSTEIMAKLNDLAKAKPEYLSLIAKLESDALLKTKFTVDFMKAHLKYLLISQEEDGSFKVFDVGSRNARGIILDNWSYTLDNPPQIDGFIMNNKGEVDMVQAKDITSKFTQFSARMATKERENEPYSPEDKQEFLMLTTRMGLDLTQTDLNQIVVDATVNGIIRSAQNRFAHLRKLVQLSFVNRFANGVNPFNLVKEMRQMNSLAYLISDVREALYEPSVMTIEGKRAYSHVPPNFMTKMIAQLKKGDKSMLNYLLTDPFYKENPWLFDLAENSEDRDNLGFFVLSGYTEAGKSTGKSYSKMSEAEIELSAINAYLNGAKKNRYAYYRVPILSDAPVMGFIQAKKNTSLEQVITGLYHVALQEEARMKKVAANPNAGFAKSYQRPDVFVYLPSLNKEFKGKDIASNAEAVKANIRAYLEAEHTKWIKKVRNTWNLMGEESKISSEIAPEERDSFLKQYYYDNFLASIMIGQITSGDEAFYKSTEDFQKRNKQLWSPGLYLDTKGYYDNEDGTRTEAGDVYTTVYMEDNTFPSTVLTAIEDALRIAVANKEISSDKMYSILAKYGYQTGKETRILKKKAKAVAINPETGNYFFTKDVNETDGQSYISLDRYKKIQIGLGRWNIKLESSYRNLVAGGAATNDLDVMMTPQKPFMYQLHKVLGNIIPTQHKNSEFILYPAIAFKTSDGSIKTPTEADVTNKFKDYKTPKLAKLLHYMNTTNTDSANFNSAVKEGGFGSQPFDKLEQATRHILDNSYYRLQQETPAHHIDEENIFGTQARKLIFSDLPSDFLVEINGVPYTKAQLWEKWNALISKDLKVAYDNTKKAFLTKKGVQAILMEEIQKQNLGEQYEEALQIIDDDFKLPLYHPLHSKRLEALITSIFRNRITKQKINGGGFVQVSSFGFSNNLKLVIEGGALKYAEVKMPHTSKEYFEPLLDEHGQLDINKLTTEQQDMLRMIGYRIPTEDKYSMLPMKVVEFLPPESGASIILPSEITTIAGSDFDIDKLFVMIPKFRSTVNFDALQNEIQVRTGKKYSTRFLQKCMSSPTNTEEKALNKVGTDIISRGEEGKYKKWHKVPSAFEDIENSDKASRGNALIDIMWSIMTHKDTFHKFINPGGFDNLKRVGNTITLLEAGAKYEDIVNLTDDELLERADEIKAKNPLNIHLSQDWVEIFTRNMTGKQLIAIFANHNTGHAVFQWGNVELESPVTFDGTPLSNLSGIKTKDGQNYISRVISSFLAAAVDNTKDPIASTINMSLFTSDTIAMLAALGYNESTIFGFMSQPILKKLSSQYFNEGASRKTAAKVSNELSTEIIMGLTTFAGKKVEELEDIQKTANYLNKLAGGVGNPNITTIEMMNAITEGKAVQKAFDRIDTITVEPDLTIANPADRQQAHDMALADARIKAFESIYTKHFDYFTLQLRVLGAFNKYAKQAKAMADVVAALRYDTPNGSIGRDLSRSEYMIEKVEKARKHDVESPTGSKTFSGLLQLIPESHPKNRADFAANYPYLDDFFQQGLYNPIYGDEEWGGLQSMFPWFNNLFRAAKKAIMEEAAIIDSQLTDKHIELINYQLMTFLSNKFTALFNREDKFDVINNTPIKLVKFLAAHPEFEDDEFLKRLSTRGATKDMPIPSISFNNTGSLSSYHKDVVVQHWEAHMGHGDPVVRQMGEQLVKYALYTQGFNFTPTSFASLIPVSFYTNYSDFNNFLKTEILENKGQVDMTDHTMFVDQFMRNMWHNSDFVGSVDKELKNITGGFKRDKTGRVVGFRIDPRDKGTSDTFFVIGKEEVVFAKYVKAYVDRQWMLFAGNAVGVYTRIGKLGIPNRITEYIPSINGTLQDNVESFININRIEAGLKPIEAMALDAIADTTGPREVEGHTSVPEDIAVKEDTGLADFEDMLVDAPISNPPVERVAPIEVEPPPILPDEHGDYLDMSDMFTVVPEKAAPIEVTPVANPINIYAGDIIPDANTVFVFGSNPLGINGNPSKGTGGAALIASTQFGVKQGEKMDNKLSDSGNAYGLTTVMGPGRKRSITPAQITENIKKLYEVARANPTKQFKIAYRNTTNKSLNGYTGLEMIDMFKGAGPIPNNVMFSKEWADTGKFSQMDLFSKFNNTSDQEAEDRRKECE